jgi:peptidoglycan/LPS O-acetylase OafA/YrhL
LIRSESRNALQFHNSFGLIRLGLAVVVVFHHTLVLTGHDALSFIGRSKNIDIGTIGVAGFFAISGFLLLGSSRRLSARKFLTHRFFRLFPGLWACLIVTAFILVPFANYFSKFESSMYFFKIENSSFSYVVFNSALLVLQDSIGTVFAQNPYPIAVNGSLWTLAPEFICYIGLLIVATLSRRNRKLQFLLIGKSEDIRSIAAKYGPVIEKDIKADGF